MPSDFEKYICRFWLALSHYIKAQECTALEPAVRDLLSLSKKVTIGFKILVNIGNIHKLDVSGNVHALGLQLGNDLLVKPTCKGVQE